MTVRTSCRSTCPTNEHNGACQDGGRSGFRTSRAVRAVYHWNAFGLKAMCTFTLYRERTIPQGEAGMNRRLGPNLIVQGTVNGYRMARS